MNLYEWTLESGLFYMLDVFRVLVPAFPQLVLRRLQISELVLSKQLPDMHSLEE